MNNKGNWEVKIRKVNNGFICEYEEEMLGEEDSFKTEEVLFTNDKNEESEIMKDVLLWIKEYFGVYWSKHNERNLSIEIKEDSN